MSSWTRDISSSGSEDCSEECNLVVRAQGGDQVAFEVLYERYNDRICRYLIRMVGNDGVGCELTQETFLKAWEALSGLRAPARFIGLPRTAHITTNTMPGIFIRYPGMSIQAGWRS